MKRTGFFAIKAATVLAILALVAMFWMANRPVMADQVRYLTIKGSDTMVHLTSSWAEAFMKGRPNADVSVTGGGSGTGIAALINGTTDICAASREMKDKELQQAKEKGMAPVEHIVARDGIAVIVHPKNPLSELTVEQIRLIYTGHVTNWKQLGGPDAKIIVLSRESSSGTYVFFQEHVLDKQDYAEAVRLMPATSAIIQTVAADQWSIGYVGLGYTQDAAGKIKVLAVKANDKAPAVLPSDETVKSGTYSISRPLYLYTPRNPEGLAKEFIDFCLGAEGQKIVKETGYIMVTK